MDSEDYSFFLAYGMTQEEEELLSLLDVDKNDPDCAK